MLGKHLPAEAPRAAESTRAAIVTWAAVRAAIPATDALRISGRGMEL